MGSPPRDGAPPPHPLPTIESVLIVSVFLFFSSAQAVQSLDETINEIFGDGADRSNGGDGSGSGGGNSGGNGRGDTSDGWVELRGGAPAPASALLDPEAAAAEASASAAAAAAATVGNSGHSWSGSSSMVASAGAGAAGAGGYPGAFIMGSGAGRAGGAKGRGRVFGTPLEELVLNPDR